MLYYFISYQRQDKNPWRVVRVWNGKYRTILKYATKAEAQALVGGMPTQDNPDFIGE